MQVRIVGDLKIKEENDGVTFSCQGLSYSEIPVTQHRLSQIQTIFQKFRPDDPILAIEYAIKEGNIPFLEEWSEGIYATDYVEWLKEKFLKVLHASS